MVRKTCHIPDIYKAGCTNGSLCNPPLFGFAATDYARAAVLADRASREPSPQGDAQPTSATLRCRRCDDTADVSFSYASTALAKENSDA